VFEHSPASGPTPRASCGKEKRREGQRMLHTDENKGELSASGGEGVPPKKGGGETIPCGNREKAKILGRRCTIPRSLKNLGSRSGWVAGKKENSQTEK